MAIDFSGSSTDRLNIGAAAALAWKNNSVATLLFWVFPTAVSAQRNMLSFGTTGGQLMHTAAGRIEFVGGRGTANLDILSTAGGTYGASKWCCLCAQWDQGTSGNCKLFHGDLSTAMAEYAYSVQSAGSGTINDDSAANKIVGCNGGGTQSYPGYVAYFSFVARLLTVAEIQLWQYRPGNLANMVSYYDLQSTAAADLVDRLGVGSGTLSGGANQTHPTLGAYLQGQGGMLRSFKQMAILPGVERAKRRWSKLRRLVYLPTGAYDGWAATGGVGGGGGGGGAALQMTQYD